MAKSLLLWVLVEYLDDYIEGLNEENLRLGVLRYEMFSFSFSLSFSLKSFFFLHAFVFLILFELIEHHNLYDLCKL